MVTKKITIRKEKIFGRMAYVILKNGKPVEFRYTKKGAENFAKTFEKKSDALRYAELKRKIKSKGGKK